MADLSYTLCQRDLPIQQRKLYHPPYVKDTSLVFDANIGCKIQTNACGIIDATTSRVSVVATAASLDSRTVRAILSLKALRYTQQKRSPWCQHQSLAYEKRERCVYAGYPELSGSQAERPRKYFTNMRCEECSAIDGYDVFLCDGIKGLVEGEKKTWKVCTCHIEYHKARYNNK